MAHGKEGESQLLLGQAPQEVGLVLGAVAALEQAEPAAGRLEVLAGIPACAAVPMKWQYSIGRSVSRSSAASFSISKQTDTEEPIATSMEATPDAFVEPENIIGMPRTE